MAEPEPEPEPDVPTFQFSQIMDVFLPQTQTTETEERGWSELPAQEDDGSPHRPHSDGFPQFDISAALMSVAVKQTWTLEKRFSASEPNEDQSFSSFDDQDKDANGEEDPDKEVLGVTFQSKFMHIFPLYQDYCLQAVRKDLLRFDKTFLSELISPEFLQSVQSCLSPSGPPEVSQPLLRSAEVTCPSPLAQPIRVTPCTLWHQLDEVKASGLIGSLTSREIHLQESMFELIGSEASYLRSLGVAVDHFYASKALRRTLPRMEHHILFSNIRPIRAASEKFLVDLELRLGQSVLISQVGDIVLQHCPEFHSLYVPYVTNMMYQEALVNQLLQQNKDFVCSLKKLESDPLCQRQNLKSFLVLPFQRITRMKLLLENVLKLNEPESESVSNLEKAIQAIHEIVTECNNGVRKMKRIEELVSLETLLDFDKVKSIPLVASRRFLVHHGPLTQVTVEGAHSSRPTFTSVHLHLFNDLLIISCKRDQRFLVTDHAEFPRHVRTERLKSEILGLPANSFLLHLSQSQTGHPTAMIFVTHTKSENDTWLKMLSNTH